jgi:hypothetical protein
MKGLSKKVGIMSGLAALALVGSAFAVWHFGTDANKATDGDYYVTKAVDYGTAVLNVTGIDAEPASKLLILDQPNGTNGNTEAENTTAGVHWHVGSAIDFTHTILNPTTNAAAFKYTLTISFSGALANYVDFVANAEPVAPVKSVAANSYVYEWTEAEARSEADYKATIDHGKLPAIEYKDGKMPNDVAGYNTMVSALSADAAAKVHIALVVSEAVDSVDSY